VKKKTQNIANFFFCFRCFEGRNSTQENRKQKNNNFYKLLRFFTHTLLLYGTSEHDILKKRLLFLTYVCQISSSCEYFRISIPDDSPRPILVEYLQNSE